MFMFPLIDVSFQKIMKMLQPSTGEYLTHVYTDDSIHCYMCFVCSERHLLLAGFDRFGEPSKYKGSIEYHSIGALMQQIAYNKDKWDENLDFNLWKERYGSKLPAGSTDIKEPEHGFKADSWEWRRIINCVPYGDALEAKEAICCPEDVRHHPKKCQHAKHILCKHCSVPICLECWSRFMSRTGYKIPAALANDNFQGYQHPFLVRNKVRWIEAVTACPFFSSLVTYYVEGKGKERHHLAGEELGRLERAYVRIATIRFGFGWIRSGSVRLCSASGSNPVLIRFYFIENSYLRSGRKTYLNNRFWMPKSSWNDSQNQRKVEQTEFLDRNSYKDKNFI